MKRLRVALLGDLNIDTVLAIPRFPQPGWDGLADSATVQLGGAIVNTGVVLRRLGLDCVLLGSVGDDLWAEFLLRNLSRENFDLSSVVSINQMTTGLTFIAVTPDGERTMFSYRGANVDYSPLHLDTTIFHAVDLFHLSGYALLSSPQRDAAFAALSQAETHHLPICLDSGLQPVMEAPEIFMQVLPRVTIGVLGLSEAFYLSGLQRPEQVLTWMLDLGMEWAVLKMGAEGCWLANRTQNFRLPAFPARVVDTTGAGDSFTAGIICAYLWRWELVTAAILANALGALAVQVYGAGLALPGRETLSGYLISLIDQPNWLPWAEVLKMVINDLETPNSALTSMVQE